MRNIVLMIVGITVTITIYYLSPSPDKENNLHLERKPDFFMMNFTQYGVDENGIISKSISGEKIDIYDKKGYSLIKSPFISLVKKNGMEFKLKATNGQIFNRNKILLSGGVEAENFLAKSTEVLESKTLWLYPNINFAETDQPVSIKRNLSTTKGTGAKFQIDINKMELLSDATTIYNIK